jgi:hypothetical protein
MQAFSNSSLHDDQFLGSGPAGQLEGNLQVTLDGLLTHG